MSGSQDTETYETGEEEQSDVEEITPNVEVVSDVDEEASIENVSKNLRVLMKELPIYQDKTLYDDFKKVIKSVMETETLKENTIKTINNMPDFVIFNHIKTQVNEIVEWFGSEDFNTIKLQHRMYKESDSPKYFTHDGFFYLSFAINNKIIKNIGLYGVSHEYSGFTFVNYFKSGWSDDLSKETNDNMEHYNLKLLFIEFCQYIHTFYGVGYTIEENNFTTLFYFLCNLKEYNDTIVSNMFELIKKGRNYTNMTKILNLIKQNLEKTEKNEKFTSKFFSIFIKTYFQTPIYLKDDILNEKIEYTDLNEIDSTLLDTIDYIEPNTEGNIPVNQKVEGKEDEGEDEGEDINEFEERSEDSSEEIIETDEEDEEEDPYASIAVANEMKKIAVKSKKLLSNLKMMEWRYIFLGLKNQLKTIVIIEDDVASLFLVQKPNSKLTLLLETTSLSKDVNSQHDQYNAKKKNIETFLSYSDNVEFKRNYLIDTEDLFELFDIEYDPESTEKSVVKWFNSIQPPVKTITEWYEILKNDVYGDIENLIFYTGYIIWENFAKAKKITLTPEFIITIERYKYVLCNMMGSIYDETTSLEEITKKFKTKLEDLDNPKKDVKTPEVKEKTKVTKELKTKEKQKTEVETKQEEMIDLSKEINEQKLVKVNNEIIPFIFEHQQNKLQTLKGDIKTMYAIDGKKIVNFNIDQSLKYDINYEKQTNMQIKLSKKLNDICNKKGFILEPTNFTCIIYYYCFYNIKNTMKCYNDIRNSVQYQTTLKIWAFFEEIPTSKSITFNAVKTFCQTTLYEISDLQDLFKIDKSDQYMKEIKLLKQLENDDNFFRWSIIYNCSKGNVNTVYELDKDGNDMILCLISKYKEGVEIDTIERYNKSKPLKDVIIPFILKLKAKYKYIYIKDMLYTTLEGEDAVFFETIHHIHNNYEYFYMNDVIEQAPTIKKNAPTLEKWIQNLEPTDMNVYIRQLTFQKTYGFWDKLSRMKHVILETDATEQLKRYRLVLFHFLGKTYEEKTPISVLAQELKTKIILVINAKIKKLKKQTGAKLKKNKPLLKVLEELIIQFEKEKEEKKKETTEKIKLPVEALKELSIV